MQVLPVTSRKIVGPKNVFPVYLDFQNMPGAMRPSAPRPQALNAIRPTATGNTQVPRMMASQRMREYLSF